jgi:hypothetical protein
MIAPPEVPRNAQPDKAKAALRMMVEAGRGRYGEAGHRLQRGSDSLPTSTPLYAGHTPAAAAFVTYRTTPSPTYCGSPSKGQGRDTPKDTPARSVLSTP